MFASQITRPLDTPLRLRGAPAVAIGAVTATRAALDTALAYLHDRQAAEDCGALEPAGGQVVDGGRHERRDDISAELMLRGG
jgi:hypothetical protein